MTIISLKGQEFRISIGIGVKFTIYKSTQQQAAMIPIADSMKNSGSGNSGRGTILRLEIIRDYLVLVVRSSS